MGLIRHLWSTRRLSSQLSVIDKIANLPNPLFSVVKEKTDAASSPIRPRITSRQVDGARDVTAVGVIART